MTAYQMIIKMAVSNFKSQPGVDVKGDEVRKIDMFQISEVIGLIFAKSPIDTMNDLLKQDRVLK